MNDIFPFAIQEMKKRVDLKNDMEAEAVSKADVQFNQTNIKEEAI